MLLRIQSIRIQHEYLLGRLALAGNHAASVVDRHARKLASFANPIARVWAQVLRAGLAIRAGDNACAEKLIVAVDQAAVAAGMKLTSAVVRFRLAELRGDDVLLTAAATDMAELGIRVPSKMTALLFPTGTR